MSGLSDQPLNTNRLGYAPRLICNHSIWSIARLIYYRFRFRRRGDLKWLIWNSMLTIQAWLAYFTQSVFRLLGLQSLLWRIAWTMLSYYSLIQAVMRWLWAFRSSLLRFLQFFWGDACLKSQLANIKDASAETAGTYAHADISSQPYGLLRLMNFSLAIILAASQFSILFG